MQNGSGNSSFSVFRNNDYQQLRCMILRNPLHIQTFNTELFKQIVFVMNEYFHDKNFQFVPQDVTKKILEYLQFLKLRFERNPQSTILFSIFEDFYDSSGQDSEMCCQKVVHTFFTSDQNVALIILPYIRRLLSLFDTTIYGIVSSEMLCTSTQDVISTFGVQDAQFKAMQASFVRLFSALFTLSNQLSTEKDKFSAGLSTLIYSLCMSSPEAMDNMAIIMFYLHSYICARNLNLAMIGAFTDEEIEGHVNEFLREVYNSAKATNKKRIVVFFDSYGIFIGPMIKEMLKIKMKIKESGNSHALKSSIEVCKQTPIAKEIEGTANSFVQTLSFVDQQRQQIIQQQQQQLEQLEMQSSQMQ